MPICPKCGKILSTQQALDYHLNKKNKCMLLQCKKCEVVFDTKHDLRIHAMSCLSSISTNYSNDIFDKILNSSSTMIVMILDNKYVIKTVSPNCRLFLKIKPKELIGNKFFDIFDEVDNMNVSYINNNTTMKYELIENIALIHA